MSDIRQPSYPVVNFLVRRGAALAVVLAVLPPLLGLYLVVAGLSWVFLAGGVVIGGVVFVMVKSYVELVSIISDMLLPKY